MSLRKIGVFFTLVLCLCGVLGLLTAGAEGVDPSTLVATGSFENAYCTKCGKETMSGSYNEQYCWGRVCSYCHYFDTTAYPHSGTCVGNSCTDCGAVGVVIDERSHGTKVYAHDATHHWYACEYCGEAQGEKSEHSIYCDAPTTCLYCNATDCTPVQLRHENSSRVYDDTHHWYACDLCGEAANEKEAHRGYCDGICWYCNAENVTIAEPEHENYTDTYEYDATHHWRFCANCGAALDKSEHYFSWYNEQYDDTYHWIKCSYCEAISEKVQHEVYCTNQSSCTECDCETVVDGVLQHSDYWVDWVMKDEKYHEAACVDCGTVFTAEHEGDCDGICDDCGGENVVIADPWHFDEIYDHDDTHCWYICSNCSEVTGSKWEHTARCTAPTTCQNCQAEGVTISTVYHSGSYAYTDEHDDTYHWEACGDCGEVMGNKIEHYVYCDNPTACYSCGATDVTYKIEHKSYSWQYEIRSDETHHWYACPTCGEATGEKSVHTGYYCNDTTCRSCGAENAIMGNSWLHSGDTVYGYDDLSHWTVCGSCGELKQNGDKYLHASACDGDGKTCAICQATDVTITEVDHDFKSGSNAEYCSAYICTGCGLVDVNRYKYAHYLVCGDTKCLWCDMENPVVSEEDIHHDKYDYLHDENGHWYGCVGCGKLYESDWYDYEYEPHYAYCTDPSTCPTCEATDITVYPENIEHPYESRNEGYDETYHWEQCNDCGEIYWKNQHYASCTDPNVCASCGAEGVTFEHISHNYLESDYTYDADYHYMACVDCGENTYKEYHRKDCQTGVCVDCGQEDVTFHDIAHNFTFYHDDVEHWYVCRYCGYEDWRDVHYNSCTNSEFCDACEARDVTFAWTAHEGGYDYTYDNECHYSTCRGCGEQMEDLHWVECTGLPEDSYTTCDECGATGVELHVSHWWNDAAWEYNDTEHWVYCSAGCGTMVDSGEHWAYCDFGLENVCQRCNAANVIVALEHNDNGSNVKITYDETYHTTACDDCDYSETYEHYGYCCAGACYYCGAEGVSFTEDNTYIKNFTTTYDAYNHTDTCSDCGYAQTYPHWRYCYAEAKDTCAYTNCAATGLTFTEDQLGHKGKYTDGGRKCIYNCSYCEYTEEADHNMVNGKCSRCGRVEGQRTPGDANSDGIVDIMDALEILQFSVGWGNSLDRSNSDVDASGTVDIMDALLILQYSVGWPVELL